ncbi:MAG TPA: hypothetical protein VFT72_09810 [Opitutaceae bacterium]|nr:hypothetical protein [Opitutaceae bacterium]
MKRAALLTVLTLLLVLAKSTSAATPRSELVLVPADQAQNECAQLPSILETVRFRGVPARFNDTTVQVLMTIDEDGLPRDIKGLEPLPLDLASSLVPSIERWKFNPALDKDGKPIALRVVLPVKLVGLL